jgi:hypothetical protein
MTMPSTMIPKPGSESGCPERTLKQTHVLVRSEPPLTHADMG